MTFSTIELRIEGPVAHITLNRPDKLNALSGEMVRELHRALDESEVSAEVRAITLRGAGRAFCSGFDLGELQSDAEVTATRRILEADFEIILRFWNSPKPTIAASSRCCCPGSRVRNRRRRCCCSATIASARNTPTRWD